MSSKIQLTRRRVDAGERAGIGKVIVLAWQGGALAQIPYRVRAGATNDQTEALKDLRNQGLE
jgi:hypothetical protein